MRFSATRKIAARRYGMTAIPLLFALIFSSCGKANPLDVERVEIGMSADEVHAILGAPHSSSSGKVGAYLGVSDTWRTATMIITVQYLNNEVKLKTIEMRDLAPAQ